MPWRRCAVGSKVELTNMDAINGFTMNGLVHHALSYHALGCHALSYGVPDNGVPMKVQCIIWTRIPCSLSLVQMMHDICA